jgi:hypothetical protein
VCGGPCGVLVTCEIKEEGSLDLSDRLREGKGESSLVSFGVWMTTQLKD